MSNTFLENAVWSHLLIAPVYPASYNRYIGTPDSRTPTEGPIKILIVDDDPTFRIYLQKILERQGWSDYEIAVDGLNAVEYFTGQLGNGLPFDLIFLDVNMPNKNGIDTIREIRAIERARRVPQNDQVKVIMTTSSTDDTVLSNAFDALCDGYVVKPYDRMNIVDQLKSLGFPVND